MQALPKLITVDDLEAFPDDGMRYEIIGGVLSMSPAPLKRHQRLLGRLFLTFNQAVEASGAGEVFFSPVDVRFSRYDQVQPDLIFIRAERAEIYPTNTVFGAPDIVVEVISPSNKSYDEVSKFNLFERHGVPEYWIIDPEKKTIRQFVLIGDRYTACSPADAGFASTVLPGLVIEPSQLFRDIDA